MRINVSEAYREKFEVFISKYQKFCDIFIDLVVYNVPIEKLKEYCSFKHPDVMSRLTVTVSSSDIVRGIVNKCSITNITPLKDVIQHCRITEGKRMNLGFQSLFKEVQGFQRSLDEYLLQLRAGYLLRSSKDIAIAETIIFILDWTPDEASFLSIKHLLYEAFICLNKSIIIVQDTDGKKILHLFHNDVANIPFFAHTHTHTHTCVSISLLLYAV